MNDESGSKNDVSHSDLSKRWSDLRKLTCVISSLTSKAETEAFVMQSSDDLQYEISLAVIRELLYAADNMIKEEFFDYYGVEL